MDGSLVGLQLEGAKFDKSGGVGYGALHSVRRSDLDIS